MSEMGTPKVIGEKKEEWKKDSKEAKQEAISEEHAKRKASPDAKRKHAINSLLWKLEALGMSEPELRALTAMNGGQVHCDLMFKALEELVTILTKQRKEFYTEAGKLKNPVVTGA